MAFVYKEERKTLSLSNNEIGPGEYLPQTVSKKIKINQNAPFETQEQRLKSSLNLNPGPGTYYYNESEIKLKKKVAQSAIAHMNQDELIAQEELKAPYDINEPNKTKYILRPDKEKLGFEVKDKRFKNEINDIQGPGK